jgi:prefoldin subunit 4
LAEAKEDKKKEIRDIEQRCKEVQDQMAELKGQLYNRFGNHIYLENDEE